MSADHLHLMRDDGTPYCPEAYLRDQMDDGEFWAHVFHQGDEGDDEPDDFVEPPDDDPRSVSMPCAECGELGPCGYDADDRPMVHLLNEDDQ